MSARRRRYLLELGRGGMGTVYVAQVEPFDEGPHLVAIKRINPELSDVPEARRMFLDEARLSARIAHANVVRARPAEEHDGVLSVEMELLEGLPLDAILRWARTGGALPPRIALYVVRMALLGLHAAHELRDDDGRPLSVVHRDVSPHNLFVLFDGGVKVLDFGIAKAIDSSARTRTGLVKGKLTYMAPEQAARTAVDRRADVFAAGVVLWESLTGQRYWSHGLDELELLARLRSGELPAVDVDRSALPEPLVALCARAMAPLAADRFSTALEFAEAIEGHARERGLSCDATEVAAFMESAFGGRRRAAAARLQERIAAAGVGASDALDLMPQERAAGGAATAPTVGALGVTKTGLQTGERIPTGRRRPWASRILGRPSLLALGLLLLGGGLLATRARIRSHAASAPPPAAQPARCTSHAACARDHGGEAWACRALDGRCVPMATPDCSVRADARALTDERTIWFGTMFPLTGPDAKAFGEAHANATELARQDLMRAASGVPSRDATAPPRPLALVSCDDASDPARVARHLVEDVGVQAVVGFRSSKEVIDLATSLFIPRGVVAVASLNASPALTQLPHPPGSPRLVWRTATSSRRSIEPWGPLVDDLLAPRLKLAGKLRVALVRNGTAAGIGLSDAVVSTLRFNGKSVAENGTSFREVVYGDPTGTESEAKHAAAVAAIVEFAPHVILYVLVADETRTLLAPIEARWRDADHRPYHVLGATWEGAEFLKFLGKDAARRRRFLGLRTPSATPTNTKFTLRYNETFPDKISPSTAPGAPYDAVYMLAYASFVAAGPTGRELARGLEKLLPPGPHVDVGPGGIFDAFATLRTGGRIDLDGAWSKLDFDPTTGDAPSDFVVVCPGVGPDGSAADGVESGVTYDAATHKLEGSLACP
jgi:ABC-type branched-subunit amino acid transport system substrate-binding protein